MARDAVFASARHDTATDYHAGSSGPSRGRTDRAVPLHTGGRLAARPGTAVSRLAGMCVCSATTSESKPRSFDRLPFDRRQHPALGSVADGADVASRDAETKPGACSLSQFGRGGRAYTASPSPSRHP